MKRASNPRANVERIDGMIRDWERRRRDAMECVEHSLRKRRDGYAPTLLAAVGGGQCARDCPACAVWKRFSDEQRWLKRLQDKALRSFAITEILRMQNAGAAGRMSSRRDEVLQMLRTVLSESPLPPEDWSGEVEKRFQLSGKKIARSTIDTHLQPLKKNPDP